MILRMFAIGAIFVLTSIAWTLLGGAMQYRTHNTDDRLRDKVGSLWGTAHCQEAPRLSVVKSASPAVTTLQSSDVKVDIDLHPRKKGLLWYSTYAVHFQGTYGLVNPTDQPADLTVTFKLPDPRGNYDNVHVSLDDQEIVDPIVSTEAITVPVTLAAAAKRTFTVTYASRGQGSWHYNFGTGRVKNFTLVMTTNFHNVDFPDDSQSPTTIRQTDGGMELTWHYDNKLSDLQVGMVMPAKLNPGPWVSRVTFSAPVSLALFFFMLFIVTTLRHIDLHPMNYFFLAAAFFAYHLLLSYLVDHINIHLAFWIASAVSVALVVTYMRLVTGARFALGAVGLSQLIYLVLFSYTFFFEGFTGLAITILGIVTLFVVMQATGRLNWSQVFAGRSIPTPAPAPVNEPPDSPSEPAT